MANIHHQHCIATSILHTSAQFSTRSILPARPLARTIRLLSNHYTQLRTPPIPNHTLRKASSTAIRIPTTARLQARGSLTHMRAMSSDADYASFLEKANQNTSSVSATTAQASNYGTKSVDDGVEVPEVLRGREEVYVSDADEEFVGVGLRFGGSAVGADDLKKLLNVDDVQGIRERDFDPRGQYKGVVEAVQKAAGGEVRFFRVGLGGTRSEVWIVGVDREGGRLVGVKALVVES